MQNALKVRPRADVRTRPGFRPALELLESRWQPGSVLSGDLGLSLWASGLAFLNPVSAFGVSEQPEVAPAAAVRATLAGDAAPLMVGGEGRGQSPAPTPTSVPLPDGAAEAADLAVLAAVPVTQQDDGQSTRGCPINYIGGFPDVPGNLTANGSALFASGLAFLTTGGNDQAGSIFSNGLVNVAGFYNYFYFQIVPGSTPMADGMAFVIQRNNPNALGPTGGGLGYGPDQPGGPPGILNSIAVKFDIFNNAGEGLNSTGLFRNGRSPTVPRSGGDVLYGLDGTGIDLNNQSVYSAEMIYDGSLLEVTITNLGTSDSASQTYRVNIPAVVGGTTAHVGFTGGTGGLNAFQFVYGWIYC